MGKEEGNAGWGDGSDPTAAHCPAPDQLASLFPLLAISETGTSLLKKPRAYRML